MIIIKKTFDSTTSGVFQSSCYFYFEPHTYNYSLNSEQTLISPELDNMTIVLEQREYNVLHRVTPNRNTLVGIISVVV